MKFNYYHIINLLNNKEYIGITEKKVEERFKEHKKNLKANKHCNYKLQNDWNKFGENNFCFELIESIEYENLEDGYQHEYELINNSRKELYNLAPGGIVNPIYSEEIRTKMIMTKQKQVPNVY